MTSSWHQPRMDIGRITSLSSSDNSPLSKSFRFPVLKGMSEPSSPVGAAGGIKGLLPGVTTAFVDKRFELSNLDLIRDMTEIVKLEKDVIYYSSPYASYFCI